MGASAASTSNGAASSAALKENLAPITQVAQRIMPMPTSLSGFQKANHYDPVDLVQTYVNGSKPDMTYAQFQNGGADPVVAKNPTQPQSLIEQLRGLYGGTLSPGNRAIGQNNSGFTGLLF
jgi:hypothetical protein